MRANCQMALFVIEAIFTTFPAFCPEDTSTFLFVCLLFLEKLWNLEFSPYFELK